MNALIGLLHHHLLHPAPPQREDGQDAAEAQPQRGEEEAEEERRLSLWPLSLLAGRDDLRQHPGRHLLPGRQGRRGLADLCQGGNSMAEA